MDSPVMRVVLLGVYDPGSILHRLKGIHRGMLQLICEYVRSSIDEMYAHCFENNVASYLIPGKRWQLPARSDVYYNMLPIYLDDPNFPSVPMDLQEYIPLIQRCVELDFSLKSRKQSGRPVGYLTVMESRVKKGESQRRPGLHIDSPMMKMQTIDKGRVKYVYRGQGHGRGRYFDGCHGGMFLCSNVDFSTGIFNAECKKESQQLLLSGAGPSGSSLNFCRKILNSRFTYSTLAAGELMWLTDMTVHESLPVKRDTQRTFFRLVTGPVTIRWEQDSTSNPRVKLPGRLHIVEQSKAHLRPRTKDHEQLPLQVAQFDDDFQNKCTI